MTDEEIRSAIDKAIAHERRRVTLTRKPLELSVERIKGFIDGYLIARQEERQLSV